MRTTIELPESVYRQSQKIARLRGFSVEQFLIETLERALQAEPPSAGESRRIDFPLIFSSHPGTLDLADFDFDDLLA
jgi:hypothetical protein